MKKLKIKFDNYSFILIYVTYIIMYFYIFICQHLFCNMLFLSRYYYFAYKKIKNKVYQEEMSTQILSKRFSDNSLILQAFLFKLPDKENILKIFFSATFFLSFFIVYIF